MTSWSTSRAVEQLERKRHERRVADEAVRRTATAQIQAMKAAVRQCLRRLPPFPLPLLCLSPHPPSPSPALRQAHGNLPHCPRPERSPIAALLAESPIEARPPRTLDSTLKGTRRRWHATSPARLAPSARVRPLTDGRGGMHARLWCTHKANDTVVPRVVGMGTLTGEVMRGQRTR